MTAVTNVSDFDRSTHVRIAKPQTLIINEMIKVLTNDERTDALFVAGKAKYDRMLAAKDKGDHALEAGKQFVFFNYVEQVSQNARPAVIESFLMGCITSAKRQIRLKKDIIYNQGILSAAIDHQKKLALYECVYHIEVE